MLVAPRIVNDVSYVTDIDHCEDGFLIHKYIFTYNLLITCF